MPRVFAGTVDGDFILSPSGDSIVNAHQEVTFNVTDDDGKTHSARLMTLSLRIEGTELQMDVQTKTELSPGVRAWCHTQDFMAITLVDKPDGTQTLGFGNARPAVVENWTEKDPGFAVAEIVLAIVSAIALAIAIVATAGTIIAVAAIVIGVVAGVTGGALLITETAIEQAGKNDAPSIDTMLLNATAPIVWADPGDFNIGLARLSDSLQLGGTPSQASTLMA